MDIQHGIWSVPLGLGLFGVGCTTVAQLCAHAKLHRRSQRRSPRALPPISILKPLKGLDDELAANLRSFALQDYPDFELLLGVEDASDPALPVAYALQREFPHVPMRIVCRRGPGVLNPKVSNLLNLVEVARHEWLLISDSNVSVDSSYLRKLASELHDPRVGLVSNVIVGRGERSLGAVLENVQLNSFVLAGVCFGDALGHPLVVGKSMLLRRAALDALGGFHAVGDVLAEDYVLGRSFHEAGHRVVLSADPVYTVNRHWKLSRVLSRHLRWAQLRRWGSLPAFIAELAMYPLPWLALACVLAHASHARQAALLALLACAFRVCADFALLWHARGARPHALAPLMLLVRDPMLLALWCVALVKRTVVWRGNARVLGAGTRLTASHANAGENTRAPVIAGG